MAASLLTRLAKVEAAARERQQEKKANARRPTDEHWLLWYLEDFQAGEYASEPDFEKALCYFGEAVLAARERTDPPWHPPADFEPQSAPDTRLANWRGNPTRFPEINDGRTWLGEMANRVADGVPPTTEGEFRELVEWFDASYSRLREITGLNGLLELGDGKRESLCNLIYYMKLGPRVYGAGELAVKLRAARQRYGG